MAQTVKNPPAIRETWVWSLVWEDPLEEGRATHSSILVWRIPMDRGAWWATVHGILQARILEWVAIPFSRGSSWPRDQFLPSKPPGKPLHTERHCFWNGLYRPLCWDTTFVLEEVASCKSTTNDVELPENSKVSVQEGRSYKWAHLINEHYNSSHRLNINSNV